jgi:type II secretory pathway pseudopilin PulG
MYLDKLQHTGLRSQEAQGQGMQALRKEAYISVRCNDERCRITPRLRFLRTQSGFSYIGVLLAVAIAGIAMTAANRYWSTVIQREREVELLFRGDQIRQGIEAYYENPPEGQTKQYPRIIEDLLKDPRYPQTRRHLRRWYKDPFTGKNDWAIVRDAGGRIKGVHSTNPGRPLKTGDFPKAYGAFKTAVSYADWKFIYTPQGNASSEEG